MISLPRQNHCDNPPQRRRRRRRHSPLSQRSPTILPPPPPPPARLSPPSPQQEFKVCSVLRGVSFCRTVEILEFPIILDTTDFDEGGGCCSFSPSPSCPRAPNVSVPLTLDWNVQRRELVDLNDYEASQMKKRRMRHLDRKHPARRSSCGSTAADGNGDGLLRNPCEASCHEDGYRRSSSCSSSSLSTSSSPPFPSASSSAKSKCHKFSLQRRTQLVLLGGCSAAEIGAALIRTSHHHRDDHQSILQQFLERVRACHPPTHHRQHHEQQHNGGSSNSTKKTKAAIRLSEYNRRLAAHCRQRRPTTTPMA